MKSHALIRSSQIGTNHIQHAIVPFSWDIRLLREALKRDFSEILNQSFLEHISCVDIIEICSQQIARILDPEDYSSFLYKGDSVSGELAA